ncbi:type III-A CRISPR-associated protein Csm2 [Oceanicella actignis]|uniref:CRISPR system Cms protein Csm2 n=1 Tax=Oceanicella actignis TaxID=1189325 RepID=A0A1M7S1F1_9RHOB|nr:type III-A CRISPR-associated protein Csm2 [Oceanicella actignis]SES91429.1 CRISPR-associated protein Csm2 [Oceanicella actignis]SHN52427.1 CRISPR-associated protein Csm2 [Oceanicella actignis]
MNAQTSTGRPRAYFTSDGVPRHELFDEEARAEAKNWAQIKPSQVRRFFGQTKADLRKIELDGEKAVDEQALVAMAFLKATTAYAAAREKARQALAEFAAHHAALVRGIEDFKVFARHFEAVVAWHRVFDEQNKPGRSEAGRHANGRRG